ncbi:hypothetical protein, partial [Pseudomonas aeruginosa]
HPRDHSRVPPPGTCREATLGLVFGFCLMMVLDTALG